jgi:hypothetical protein
MKVTETQVQPARPCAVWAPAVSSVAVGPWTGRPPETAGTTGLTSLALLGFLREAVRVTLLLLLPLRTT